MQILDGVEIEETQFPNELRTLSTLTMGLVNLAANVRRLEFRCAGPDDHNSFMFGNIENIKPSELNLLTCSFHWFGTSVCNYARLAGFVIEISRGNLDRAWLNDNGAKVKHAVKAYIDTLPELADVLVWRNKVAAHFAITDPRKDDNIATLDMSILHPVSFSGNRFRVNELVMTRSTGNESHTSAIPAWSVTEVFESLMPRYWPGYKDAWEKLSVVQTDTVSDQKPT